MEIIYRIGSRALDTYRSLAPISPLARRVMLVGGAALGGFIIYWGLRRQWNRRVDQVRIPEETPLAQDPIPNDGSSMSSKKTDEEEYYYECEEPLDEPNEEFYECNPFPHSELAPIEDLLTRTRRRGVQVCLEPESLKRIRGAIEKLMNHALDKWGSQDGYWVEGTANCGKRKIAEALDAWERAVVDKCGIDQDFDVFISNLKALTQIIPRVLCYLDPQDQDVHQDLKTKVEKCKQAQPEKEGALVQAIFQILGYAITSRIAVINGLKLLVTKGLNQLGVTSEPTGSEAKKGYIQACNHLMVTCSQLVLDLVYDQSNSPLMEIVWSAVNTLTTTQNADYAFSQCLLGIIDDLRTEKGQKGEIVSTIRKVDAWIKDQNQSAASIDVALEDLACRITA